MAVEKVGLAGRKVDMLGDFDARFFLSWAVAGRLLFRVSLRVAPFSYEKGFGLVRCETSVRSVTGVCVRCGVASMLLV